MTQTELNAIVTAHGQWLAGTGGQRANLDGVVLRTLSLQGKNLTRASMRNVEAENVVATGCILDGADLQGSVWDHAKLNGEAKLRKTLASKGTSFKETVFDTADCTGAYFSDSFFTKASFKGATLAGVYWANAHLSGTDFSGALGLTDPIAFMEEHFDPSADGIIVHKAFDYHYPKPAHWTLAPGSVLSEVCNMDPSQDCTSGIHFASLPWLRANVPGQTYWRCVIRWSWLMGVCVLLNSTGQARCARLELLQIEA